MMKKDYAYNSLLAAVFTVILAIFASIFLVSKPIVGITICLFPFILLISVIDKKNILYLFFLMMPLSSMPYLSANLMGIPGVKIFNLLSGLTLVLFFYHGGMLQKNNDFIERKSLLFFFIYFALFTLAVFRSLSYLPTLSMLYPENFHSNPLRYLLSSYIRPSLYLILFLYILKLIKTKTEINKCIDGICYSIFILSCLVVVVGLLNINAITLGRSVTNEVFSSFFGLHYNSIGSIYITVVPLLVYQFIERKKLAATNYILAAIAVFLLQSRSTIMVFFGGTVLLLHFLRKRKLMFILSGILGAYIIFFIPGFLARAFLTGAEGGNLDSIFTGRIDSIWVPLIMERLENINQLLWGVGRYSMMNSPLYLKGYIFQTTSAHNAFVEFFIDNGIIIFSVFMVYLVLYLKRAWIWANKINSPLGWALFTCIITYLAGTISGRKIYPDHHSMYLFPIIALFINYIRINLDIKTKG